MIPTQYLRRVTLLRDKVNSFNSFPFSLTVVRSLEYIDLHPKVTFVIGENGTGKSTLLEAIAVALGFNPEGGSRNFNFNTRKSDSILNDYLRITKGVTRPKDGFFLRAESFYNVATEIERLDEIPAETNPIIDSYGGTSLHEQSHGQSFLSLMMHRFSGKGLYILDEPEAALSPLKQLSVLSRIHNLVQNESQFIIATHSPILISYPNATIYQCSEKGLQPIAYEETEHFRITRDFLCHPERMLDILLES